MSPVSHRSRYGFNGAEKNFEMEKGLNYDLGARMYNSRVGRMFSPDPRESEYPWQSTYAYYRNNPVAIVDILGEGGLNDPEYEGTTEGEVGSACQSESTCSGEDKFTYVDKYWHSGTDGGADKGWYTKSEYDAIVGELAANYMQSENSEFASIKLSFDISKQSGVDEGNSGYLSGSGGGSTVEESDYFKSLFESFGQPDYAMEPSIVMNGEDIIGYNAISGEPFALNLYFNTPASGAIESFPLFFYVFSGSAVTNTISATLPSIKPLRESGSGDINGLTISKGSGYGAKPRFDWHKLSNTYNSRPTSRMTIPSWLDGWKLPHYHRGRGNNLRYHRPWEKAPDGTRKW